MVKLIFFCFVIFFSSKSQTLELNNEEKLYFNFLDFNNDQKISFEEINQSIQIIYQLLDKNKDNYLSESEIIELKNLIEYF